MNFRRFYKNLKNPAFERKTQYLGIFWENFENFWWKCIRKIEFVTIFGKIVAKGRPFVNDTISYKNSFPLGGGTFHVFPFDAPMGFGSF